MKARGVCISSLGNPGEVCYSDVMKAEILLMGVVVLLIAFLLSAYLFPGKWDSFFPHKFKIPASQIRGKS